MTFLDGTALVSRAFLHGFALPKKQSVAAWCEASVVLPPQVTSEPGLIDLSRTPYLREPLEAYADISIEWIDFLTSTQVGKTTFELLCAAYSIDNDPSNSMFVFPREKDAKEFASDTMLPIIKASPRIARWLPEDSYGITSTRFAMKRGTLFFSWSNSPAELSRRSVRRVSFDETNKFKEFSGKEADPISLGVHRTRVHWNRKILTASTPTMPNGYISVNYAKSDKRTYRVRCPECCEYEGMYWSNVHWGEERDPEKVKLGMLAYYECPRCHAHLSDSHKPEMLNSGVWCPSVCDVGKDGKIIGDIPVTSHRGYFLNCLYSPWLTFSEIAAAWLKAQESVAGLQDFINSWLAEPWEEKVDEMDLDSLAKTIDIYVPTTTCPDGVQLITSGADVQKTHLYYTIRGWGCNEESWLLDEGTVGDFGRLREMVLDREWVAEGTGEILRVDLLCVDRRYREDEVLKFARDSGERVRPVVGTDSAVPGHFRPTRMDRHPRTGVLLKRSVQVWTVESGFYKDRLYRLAQTDKWHLYDGVSADYMNEFMSEHKIIERTPSGKRVAVWKTRPGHQANHRLDTEVYGAVAADMRQVYRLTDPSVRVETGSWFDKQKRR